MQVLFVLNVWMDYLFVIQEHTQKNYNLGLNSSINWGTAVSRYNKIKVINLQFSSVYVFLILKICMAFLKLPKAFQGLENLRDRGA